MSKPKRNTLPVIKIPISKYDEELTLVVLFDSTENAYFSLHVMPDRGSGERGAIIMRVWDEKERLYCQLLRSTYVEPGAQFAYLVHELGGVDHEPGGSVILNLLGHDGPLENGCIIIDIPCDQVVAGYIELVAKQSSDEEEEDE